MLASIVPAVVVLGLLIIVHEFGHFIVAKRLGVGVLRFSIGFGPRLLTKVFGGTEYALSAIPFGGYVKMVGEDPDAEGGEVDQSVSFSHQRLWKRLAIVTAGPVFNVLLAFLIFGVVFAVYGARLPSEKPIVGAVMKDMPAAAAGLKDGDRITAIDGVAVDTWEALSKLIRASGGRALALEVHRGKDVLRLSVTPRAQPDKNLFGEVLGTAYVIGIERGMEREDVGVLSAVRMAATQTWWWTQALIVSVAKILQGKIASRDIGGPLLIAQAAGQQWQMGLENLLHFMAVISINLGVLNLLPIPVLDGGHVLFCVIEAIRRRPLKLRHREIAQQVGLVLLMGLMVFAFYNDIARFLSG